MARIRSIHPGLFTDEAFMTASPHARLLIIGIWTEAWDDGVFEWKPLTLKARLFPVDAVSIPDLLGELVGLDFIRQFEAGGKQYGAIRNFQKYQRPKKPNSSGVMPESLASYVHAVPNQYGTGGENPPQMEDGGGEEKETEGATAPSSGAAAKIDYVGIENQCRSAAGLEDDSAPGLLVIGPIVRLLEAGATLERDVLPVLRAAKAKGQRGSTWTYYLKAIERAMAQPDAIKHIPPPSKSPPLVFVAAGTEAWDAWRAYKGKSSPIKYYPEHEADGWLFPSALPPTPSHLPRNEEAA